MDRVTFLRRTAGVLALVAAGRVSAPSPVPPPRELARYDGFRPTVAGDQCDGFPLTCTDGEWSIRPTSVTHQWQRLMQRPARRTVWDRLLGRQRWMPPVWEDVAGEGDGTYVVTADGDDRVVRVMVTTTNDRYA
jgi:hypothetical protein